MNSKRLSTYVRHEGEAVDILILQGKIDKLLSGPSNFELKEDGKIWIKSLNKYHTDRKSISVQLQDENGLLVNTFDSIVSCAKFLGIYSAIVKARLQKHKPVLFNNKLIYITKKDNL